MAEVASVPAKAAAALLFATSSFLIMFVNKYVLSVYGFPSFVGLGLSQCVATVALVGVLRAAGAVEFPSMDVVAMRRLFPLPVIFVLNVLSGLGGTKRISVAMFTVLRRFNIPMTLFLNWYCLHRTSTTNTKASILLMVLGAVVAAAFDLAFDLQGFCYLMTNNVLSALLSILAEKQMAAKELNSWGLMYYNSLFAIPALAVYMHFEGTELQAVMEYTQWTNPQFLFCFCLAAVMGVLLQFSSYHCTQVNSALTTSVVGVLKNVLTSYVSMLGFGGLYLFGWLNFVGINVSIAGSFMYAYEEYLRSSAVQVCPSVVPSVDIPRNADLPSKAARLLDKQNEYDSDGEPSAIVPSQPQSDL